MDQLAGRFDWRGVRSNGQEGRVSVNETRDGKAIHLDVYENGQFKRNSAIFLPDQLPALIEALESAQRLLDAR